MAPSRKRDYNHAARRIRHNMKLQKALYWDDLALIQSNQTLYDKAAEYAQTYGFSDEVQRKQKSDIEENGIKKSKVPTEHEHEDDSVANDQDTEQIPDDNAASATEKVKDAKAAISKSAKRKADSTVADVENSKPKKRIRAPASVLAPSKYLRDEWEPLDDGIVSDEQDEGHLLAANEVPIGFWANDPDPKRVVFASFAQDAALLLNVSLYSKDYGKILTTQEYEKDMETGTVIALAISTTQMPPEIQLTARFGTTDLRPVRRYIFAELRRKGLIDTIGAWSSEREMHSEFGEHLAVFRRMAAYMAGTPNPDPFSQRYENRDLAYTIRQVTDLLHVARKYGKIAQDIGKRMAAADVTSENGVREYAEMVHKAGSLMEEKLGSLIKDYFRIKHESWELEKVELGTLGQQLGKNGARILGDILGAIEEKTSEQDHLQSTGSAQNIGCNVIGNLQQEASNNTTTLPDEDPVEIPQRNPSSGTSTMLSSSVTESTCQDTSSQISTPLENVFGSPQTSMSQEPIATSLLKSTDKPLLAASTETTTAAP